MIASPPSANAVRSVTAADLQSVCQLQFEQLALKVPLQAAQLIYQNPDKPQREVMTYPLASSGEFDLISLADLELDTDWLNALPLLELSQLSLVEHWQTYICPLNQHHAGSEYFVVWTESPLSDLQRQEAAAQAKLLNYYLVMHRECARQRAEIQLLEQVLQRTEHQLRNPLALIGLCAENLYLGLTTGIAQDQAALIRDTVQDLSHNLTDLMQCGQQAKLKTTLQDLQLIVLDTLKQLQPWVQQKQLQISYPPSSTFLVVDRWQMQQVLHNLLSNAIYFSPEGGTITFHWQAFQDEVLVQIQDQGPGLSDADLQQAFTPFYSRRPGGTGIGLAIAQKIILDHKGSVWVQNLPQGGAQFSLTLPRQGPVGSEPA